MRRAAIRPKEKAVLDNLGFIRRGTDVTGAMRWVVRHRDGRVFGEVLFYPDADVWAAEGDMGGVGGFPDRREATLALVRGLRV